MSVKKYFDSELALPAKSTLPLIVHAPFDNVVNSCYIFSFDC